MPMSWNRLLKLEMEMRGENFDERVCTLDEDAMNTEFYDGFGHIQGQPFTAWGKDWVYFPICYDGSEWVGSAPRNPCDISLEHQGG